MELIAITPRKAVAHKHAVYARLLYRDESGQVLKQDVWSFMHDLSVICPNQIRPESSVYTLCGIGNSPCNICEELRRASECPDESACKEIRVICVLDAADGSVLFHTIYRSKFNNEELSNYVAEKFGNNVEWMEVKSIEFSPSCKPEEVSE